jgi:GntR family transcriptional regulator, carbon starvation induced regulator
MKPAGLDRSEVSVTTQVYTRIRKDLLDGRLPPGRKLKIQELRDVYGVGASPIREALSLLSSEDLVDRLEQRGFRVREINARDCHDLLETRCWVEERALRESIHRGDDDWERRVASSFRCLAAITKARSGSKTAKITEWEGRHKDFHFAVVSACGSPLTLRLWQQLYDRSVRYRSIARVTSYPDRNSENEHFEIMHAVLARDADAAVALMTAHYARSVRYLHLKLFSLPPAIRPQVTPLEEECQLASPSGGEEGRAKIATTTRTKGRNSGRKSK